MNIEIKNIIEEEIYKYFENLKEKELNNKTLDENVPDEGSLLSLFGESSKNSKVVKSGKLIQDIFVNISKLDSSTQKFLGSGIRKKEGEENKDFDLITKDEKNKTIHYYEIKGNGNLDNQKSKSCFNDIMKGVKELECKYPDCKVLGYFVVAGWAILPENKKKLKKDFPEIIQIGGAKFINLLILNSISDDEYKFYFRHIFQKFKFLIRPRLDPLYKWTGGKRREIEKFFPYFSQSLQDGFKYVEPFFGGGSVFWYLNNIGENICNIINDLDADLINFLRCFRDDPNKILSYLKEDNLNITNVSDREENKELSIKEAKQLRGNIYYRWRDLDKNNELSDKFLRAARFFILNQLAFNGMRRFNSKGKFNIPYGNYKNLSLKIFDSSLNLQYINLLRSTYIQNDDFEKIIQNNDNIGTFIFIDPPYTREFNEYSFEKPFTEEDQRRLASIFLSIKNAKVMIIIDKSSLSLELYSDYIRGEYEVKYSTNIKNRFDTSATHLIITNYKDFMKDDEILDLKQIKDRIDNSTLNKFFQFN